MRPVAASLLVSVENSLLEGVYLREALLLLVLAGGLVVLVELRLRILLAIGIGSLCRGLWFGCDVVDCVRCLCGFFSWPAEVVAFAGPTALRPPLASAGFWVAPVVAPGVRISTPRLFPLAAGAAVRRSCRVAHGRARGSGCAGGRDVLEGERRSRGGGSGCCCGRRARRRGWCRAVGGRSGRFGARQDSTRR